MRADRPTTRLDIQKLGTWLDSRKAKTNCPICSHKKWLALNGEGYIGNALPYGDGTGEMYPTGFPILTLFCQNCHFVKSIAITDDLLGEITSDEQ